MASSATVGTAVIKLSFDGNGVKAQLNGVTQNIESAGKASGSKWGNAMVVAAGSLVSKGVSKIANVITSTMDSAIGRLDQLNNFPKVMTALGYSADEAESSINKISDALDGLPTTLDTMSSDVQKLAASMGNLADGEVNATSVGLALNDMFLAGGKGTEAASAGIEAYNKMLAIGKVDMEHWNSLVTYAPGQLNQLAQSLLGAGNGQAQLYEALKKGTLSLDDFNAALVKLDKEGGEGFDSFQEQTIAATDGIATQIQNVKTTVTKIVTAALSGNLEEVDKFINQLVTRVGKLAPTLIKGFVGAFNALLKALPELFVELAPTVIEALGELWMGIQDFLYVQIPQLLVDSFPTLMDSVMQLLQSLLEFLPTFYPQMIEALTNLVITIAMQLTRPDFLSLMLQGALTLFLTMVKCIPQIITSLIGALPSVIENIIAFLTDPGNIGMIIDAAGQLFMGIVMAVPQILGALLGAFGSLVGSLWDWITGAFQQFASNFGNLIGGVFRNAINGMISFIENFINGPIDLLNGFIGVINDQFGWLGVHIDPIGRVSLPRLAQGGVVNSTTTAIIGEAGKEAVIPLENNTDNWAGLLASTLATEMQEQDYDGKTINVYMTNEINNQLDAEEIGRVMVQSIRRAA